MKAIALTQQNGNDFSISYKDGMLVREEAEVSFAKHNLLCFGRASRHLTKNPVLRKGNIVSFLESGEVFSTAWLYFVEGSITLEAMQKIITDFNKSCDRDFKNKLIETRVALKNITKLDKNTILFKIQIDNQDQNFTINI